MAITRRQFLTRSGLLTAGSLLGPGLFANPFVRKAMAETIGDRYLVVVFLDGGNDGLNTVIPYDNGSSTHRSDYDGYRRTNGGGINVSTSVLDGTASGYSDTRIGTDPGSGARLALHPGLAGFKTLYDAGRLAVVQGCGYPDNSLSHEESRVVWQTGNPLGVGALAGSGWLGRHLAQPLPAGYGGNQVPGVTIDSSVAPELRQTATSVLAIEEVENFGFPYDDFHIDTDKDAKRTAFQRLYGTYASSDPQPTKSYVGDSGSATLVSSESYPQLHTDYLNDRASFSDQYDAIDRSTARDLREVAKIIYGVSRGVAGVEARFFQLSNGGYDTHSDQGGAQPDGQHFGLHQELGDSLELFYRDLRDMGVANKVVTLVWSEFSRRIEQNDNGTDHGSQGPVFVIGDALTGGVYGRHADLANLDDDGNTIYTQSAGPNRSTDFRDVYGTILKHWLNMAPATILSSVLQLDPGDPASFWTSANFDLGFLP